MPDLVAKRERERERKKEENAANRISVFQHIPKLDEKQEKIHTINNVIFNRNHWQIENRHFTTVAPLAYEMKSNETRRLAN